MSLNEREDEALRITAGRWGFDNSIDRWIKLTTEQKINYEAYLPITKRHWMGKEAWVSDYGLGNDE